MSKFKILILVFLISSLYPSVFAQNLAYANMEKIINLLIAIILLLFSSFSLRALLSIFKQKWIESISQTSTIVFLPIITFVITKVI